MSQLYMKKKTQSLVNITNSFDSVVLASFRIDIDVVGSSEDTKYPLVTLPMTTYTLPPYSSAGFVITSSIENLFDDYSKSGSANWVVKNLIISYVRNSTNSIGMGNVTIKIPIFPRSVICGFSNPKITLNLSQLNPEPVTT